MRAWLACLVAGLIIAGCVAPTAPTSTAGTALGSPELSPPAEAAATETPATSLEPSSTDPAVATTEPTGPLWTPRPPEALLLDSILSVSVDRLNMRAKPWVDSKITGVVENGDFLLVDWYGPFSHDGYTWYHAAFVADAGEPPTFGVNVRGPLGQNGWIAVAKADSPYVKKLRARCPETIDTKSVQYMLGSELLACFGSNTIELTGTFGCGGCGGAWIGSFEPDWLANPVNVNRLAAYPIGDEVGDFAIRFPPGGAEVPPDGSVIRVRGHYDDPNSATCAISVVDPMHPSGVTTVAIPREAARLACKQQFVVESLEILGTDPGFIFG